MVSQYLEPTTFNYTKFIQLRAHTIGPVGCFPLWQVMAPMPQWCDFIITTLMASVFLCDQFLIIAVKRVLIQLRSVTCLRHDSEGVRCSKNFVSGLRPFISSRLQCHLRIYSREGSHEIVKQNIQATKSNEISPLWSATKSWQHFSEHLKLAFFLKFVKLSRNCQYLLPCQLISIVERKFENYVILF